MAEEEQGVKALAGPGKIVIIGGHEDRDPRSDRSVLSEIAHLADGGKLVLATVASHRPEGYFEEYQEALADLHCGELVELYVEDRGEVLKTETLSLLKDAAGIFFTGGDQLRITSQMGDPVFEQELLDLHSRGGFIAGTSAGASVMSETMLVAGRSSETHRIGTLHMAPGLGLIPNVIIDQHFAERGRFGRLIGAVAHNPRMLGIGLDEDTAAIITGEEFSVIGSGAVYIIDGAGVTYSNVSDAETDRVLSISDIAVHVLGSGDHFDLQRRRPCPAIRAMTEIP